jgi:thiamine-phosphate pyrophosphorylase
MTVHPRLYLISPRTLDPATFPDHLAEALSGGDVACLMLDNPGLSEQDFQKLAERVVPLAQKAGTAVVLRNDTRTAGRARADGVHLDTDGEEGAEDMERALETFRPDGIVGAGEIRSRHDAMTLAEAGVDYLLFGLLSLAPEAAPHDKTIQFASWWSQLFETPCVALCGTDLDGVSACAGTGADFVALREAAWDHPQGGAEAVRAANAVLQTFSLEETNEG